MGNIRFKFLIPISFFCLGVLLFYIVWYQCKSGFSEKFDQMVIQGSSEVHLGEDALYTSLDEDMGSLDGDASNIINQESGQIYGTMRCEEVGLAAPIYHGCDESILVKGIGQYPNDTNLGEVGIHLYLGDSEKYFAIFEQLRKSDVITLTTEYGKFEYAVAYVTNIDDLNYALDNQNSSDQLVLCTTYTDYQSQKAEYLAIYCNPCYEK